MVSFKNTFWFAVLGLTVFIVNCQAEGGPPELHLFHGDKIPDLDKCLVESNFTQDDLQRIRDDPQAEPTTKQLCFGKCLAESAGFLKDGGTIDFNLVEEQIPPIFDEATKSTMIKCMEDAGKVTTCDDMANIVKCIPKPPKQ